MIAARIGPIGNVKLPSADAVAAEAVGGEVTCPTEVFSTSAGWPVVALTATAARRAAPRPSRPVVAAAIKVNGVAAEPLSVSVGSRDTAARAAVPFTEAAAAVRAGVDATSRVATDPDLAEVTPDRAPSRAAPRVAVCDGGDAVALTPDPADSVPSADAIGAQANNEPTPNVTASKPTRPTDRARPEASRQSIGSVLPRRCVFTGHQVLPMDTVREQALPAGYGQCTQPRQAGRVCLETRRTPAAAAPRAAGRPDADERLSVVRQQLRRGHHQMFC